ncbi:hypothetical protein [Nitrincola alkalisediminis]|uniref:hypothetical protein n=1 Tax=Nitrincola alkalisediminis TaxID=1366656 RepID=UPI00187515D1|nr:hypothetical protein [Nitrincola alkalisediminis]
MKKHSLALATLAVTAVLVGCKDNQTPTVVEVPSADESLPAQSETFQIGERASGEITSQSPVNLKDGTRYQVFELKVSSSDLEDGNLLEITQRGALNGTLSLFSGNSLLATSNDAERFSKLRSIVQGESVLQVVVHGRDINSFGPFTLSSGVLKVALTLDTSKLNSLPLAENGWLDQEPQLVRFQVEKAGLYRLNMASQDFDTFIKLEGMGITLENDDGPDGTDSQLVTYLEEGEYTLTLQSYGEGAGLFSVSVSESPLPEGVELQNSGNLALGDAIQGMLMRGQNVYELDVQEFGLYEVSLMSDEFDAYLELEGEGFFAEDDDGGEGTNAHLELELAPGRYKVVARGLSDHEVGLYTLLANRLD